ncbi:tripartite tricarboxylate transporter substrate binding protein [Bordetella sp. 15P40C-2]|uniref:tripartite tricarboxylate transporter substrate binding protein n=1 Tax=Bordetella sp. 15P40C-2 TaxID=2572246 RepID=UPI00132C5C35|nr:tripartite tricarboxylate transporter substrate binding protein [Bordetella sp. 15P40C-2]MVW70501.1 tripartite tricarboxylate transporter substrate binding protein [Bordetella sp. 15P40C-2]
MKIRRLLAALLATTAVGATAPSLADSFPERPIKVVVPYPAGGTTDVLVRMLQKPVADAAGQSVIVDNRPGGASVIGTSNVVQSAPDGYTVLGGDLSILVNPSLLKDLPYDTAKDFRGVTMLARAPLVLLVHPSVPANTLEELIALAKEKPGTLNFASGGYGTSTHMAGEMFRRATGLDIVHVPYQGVAPAMQALLGGQVQIYFGGTTTGLPHIQSGRLRALAITGETPSPLLPEVPTFGSRGVQGVNADTYWGIYAPAKTPDQAVVKLNEYFTNALRDPALQQRTKDLGLTLIGNDEAAHTAQMRQMIEDWKKFVKEADIRLE